MRRFTALLFAGFLAISLPIRVYSQTPKTSAMPEKKAASPLWGNLRAGAYPVGFRTLYRFDASRTWKVTRNHKGTFSPDLHGRPVQIDVWYPASVQKNTRRMRFKGYVDQHAPEAFAEIDRVMVQLNRDDISSIPHDRMAALLATRTNAFRNAPFATGRFPVVLYFGGLGSCINCNFVLAEYLASHGYIVASISLIGPSNEQTFQSRTNDDFEMSVRDMEFAWSVLCREPNVDRAKLAVMGHSTGAIDAALLGMRNGNVSAVIGLDGTYGFQGLSSVLTHAYGYAPGKMRAAFLDLRRAQGAQGNEPLDLSDVESFHHADRTFIEMKRMHHSDFTSFAMVGSEFHAPLPTGYPLNGWNRQIGSAGYQQVCRIALAFLNAKLKLEPPAMATLDQLVQQSQGATFRQQSGVPPPPSPFESAKIANASGFDTAKKAWIAGCAGVAIADCIHADRFNSWGYAMLGQHRPKDAVAIFRLNAWAHPQSANAQDSLADGYLAVGDKNNAKRSVERAIVLAPEDPAFSPTAEKSFLSEEKEKLARFK